MAHLTLFSPKNLAVDVHPTYTCFEFYDSSNNWVTIHYADATELGLFASKLNELCTQVNIKLEKVRMEEVAVV